MRVRDLRWHIMACIILIFSYAGIAICFYLSISSGKVQDSMKILGLEAVEEVKNEIENKVDSYFDIFTSNKNDSLVYETGAESTEGKKFELFATQDNDTISTKLRANGLTLNGEITVKEEFKKYLASAAVDIDKFDEGIRLGFFEMLCPDMTISNAVIAGSMKDFYEK